MEKLLEERIAVITGGGSGIGAATARLYAKHGANVVVSDLNERAATEIVSGIQSDGGKAAFIKEYMHIMFGWGLILKYGPLIPRWV